MKKVDESNNLNLQSEHSGNQISGTQNGKNYTKNDIKPKNASEVKNGERSVAKKAKTTSKLLTTFVAMTAAVGIGVGTSSQILFPTSAEAKIESVFCDETSIFCFVVVEEFEEGLTLVLYNDFTNRWVRISDSGSFEFYFEDLAPHMTYTLEIKSDLITLDSKVVYTTLERTKPDDNNPQDDENQITPKPDNSDSETPQEYDPNEDENPTTSDEESNETENSTTSDEQDLTDEEKERLKTQEEIENQQQQTSDTEDEDEPITEDQDEPVTEDQDEPVTEDQDEPIEDDEEEPTGENTGQTNESTSNSTTGNDPTNNGPANTNG